MTVLSRYVLRSFLRPLGLSQAGFLLVFVVVDLVDRLSGFIDRDVSALTILFYYVWYLPTVGVMVLPMAMLLACLFCIGGLGRYGELTAMKAAGLNLYRIFSPVLMVAFGISLAAHAFVDQVVPTANQKRSEIDSPGYRNERFPRVGGVRSRVVIIGSNRQILSIGEYDPVEERGRQVMLDIQKGGEQGTLEEKITAEEMTREREGWVFRRGVSRRFNEGQEEVVPFGVLARPDLGVLPEDLHRMEDAAEQMTNTELSRYIERKRRFGSPVIREEVERFLRTSFPFANFVIVLFGLPLSTRIRRTGRPLQVGICLLTSFVFYGCLQAGRALGWNGLLPPFWAAWMANVLFAVIGAALLSRSHT